MVYCNSLILLSTKVQVPNWNQMICNFFEILQILQTKMHTPIRSFIKTGGIMFRKMLSMTMGLAFLFSLSAEAKRYIVTVKSPQTYMMMSAEAKGQNTFGAFSQANSKFHFLNNGQNKITDAFDNLNMVVVDVNSQKDIAALKATADVDVEEEMIFAAPKPIVSLALRKLEAPKSTKTVLDIPWGIKAVRAQEAAATSKSGEGVRVLILDTGIDKDHPAIASRFEKGRNFTQRKDKPAYDYFDSIGHGTHVAGTIAGDGVNGNLLGVAPKAKLLSARVCAEDGCSTVAILAGIDWGISEKVDVMNLSLGGPIGTTAQHKAYDRAEAAGIVVVAASGNGDPKTGLGENKVGYPAAYADVVAVGAVDINLEKAKFSNWGKALDVVAPGVNVFSSVPQGTGRAAEIELVVKSLASQITGEPFSGSGVDNVSGEVVFVELGKPENFTGLDLHGKICLVKRGELTFKEKADNCIAAGATAVVVFNHEDGLVHGTLGDDPVTHEPVMVKYAAVGISKADGEAILAGLSTGDPVSLSAAVVKTDYAFYDGTSMATPHTTGVVALIRGANPKLSAAQVRKALTDTATTLAGPNDENQLGHGLINAEAAANLASTMKGAKPGKGKAH